MIGKKIKLNDYKFTYGEETIYLNVYGAFKYAKNGNKYVIYSYDNNNKKLCYGSYFQRDKEAVIMTSKNNPKEIIKEFINMIIKKNKDDKFENISLDEINSIEIIDELVYDEPVDILLLHDITIPKPVVKEEKVSVKKKKPFSVSVFFFVIFILVVIAFFIFNPEVIIGKDRNYICTKSYSHKKLPATITEEVSLTFSGKSKIKNIDVKEDYVFNDIEYYTEFKDKSYFYKYMEEGDTYKFIDDKYTYRVFSSINTKEEYFLPTEENDLISYYQNQEYTCKVVDIDE